MGKWFRQFEALIWAVSLALGSLVFAYATFATKEYVDTKVQSIDEKLSMIISLTKLIEQRTYEQAKEKR